MTFVCYDKKRSCRADKCPRQSGCSAVYSIALVLILALCACYWVHCDGLDHSHGHPCKKTCLAMGFTKATSIAHSAWGGGNGGNDGPMCRRKCRKRCRKLCRGNRKCKRKCRHKCRHRCSSFWCHGAFRICVMVVGCLLALLFLCLTIYTYREDVGEYKKNYD